MTSSHPRDVLTYRLVLADDVSWPLRVAAIGFIPGFHATRGGPLVPTPRLQAKSVSRQAPHLSRVKFLGPGQRERGLKKTRWSGCGSE